MSHTHQMEDLTNWYVKMNRTRLKGAKGAQEASLSIRVLFQVQFKCKRVCVCSVYACSRSLPGAHHVCMRICVLCVRVVCFLCGALKMSHSPFTFCCWVNSCVGVCV